MGSKLVYHQVDYTRPRYAVVRSKAETARSAIVPEYERGLFRSRLVGGVPGVLSVSKEPSRFSEDAMSVLTVQCDNGSTADNVQERAEGLHMRRLSEPLTVKLGFAGGPDWQAHAPATFARLSLAFRGLRIGRLLAGGTVRHLADKAPNGEATFASRLEMELTVSSEAFAGSGTCPIRTNYVTATVRTDLNWRLDGWRLGGALRYILTPLHGPHSFDDRRFFTVVCDFLNAPPKDNPAAVVDIEDGMRRFFALLLVPAGPMRVEFDERMAPGHASIPPGEDLGRLFLDPTVEVNEAAYRDVGMTPTGELLLDEELVTMGSTLDA